MAATPEVQTDHQNGEERALSEFERRMVVCARRASLSISKTTDLYKWSEKEKISSEHQLCG